MNVYKDLYSDPAGALRKAEHYINPSSAQAAALSASVKLRLLMYCYEACTYLGSDNLLPQYMARVKALRPQLSHANELVDYFQSMGVCCYFVGQKNEALKHLSKVLRLAVVHQISDREIRQSLQLLGLMHCRSGQHADAVAMYQRILQIYPKNTIDADICPQFCNLAEAYAAMGRQDKAVVYFELGLKSARAGKQPVVLLQMLTSIGEFSVNTKQQMAAAGYIAEALKLSHKINMRHSRDKNTLLLARIHVLNNEHDAALKIVSQLLKRTEESDRQTLFRVLCLKLFAKILEDKGAHSSAREAYLRMAEIAAFLGLRPELAQAYNRLSAIEERRGEYAQALLYHKVSANLWLDVLAPSSQLELEEVGPKEKPASRRVAHNGQLLSADVQLKAFEQEIAEDEIFHLAMNSRSFSEHSADRAVNTVTETEVQKYGVDEALRMKAAQTVPLLARLKFNLLRRAPKLTPTEIKICLLITCGLLSKEIAPLLCNSVETVNTHRKNIRRKLKLSSGENLVTFLNSL